MTVAPREKGTFSDDLAPARRSPLDMLGSFGRP